MYEITKYNNDMNTVAFRKFNSTELNVFMAICTELRDKNLETVTFKFKDLKDLCNFSSTDTNDFVHTLDNTYNKLMSTNIKIGNEKKWTRFVLFTEYTIDIEVSEIKISVNKPFQYILNELTSNFTAFELEEFINLKSSYSKECYRHLKQFRTTGKWLVSIDEFRRLLDIPNTYRMCDIDAYVLKPIMSELSSTFRNLQVLKRKQSGRGRGGSVKELYFTFTPEVPHKNTGYNQIKSHRNKKEKLNFNNNFKPQPMDDEDFLNLERAVLR